MIKILSDDKVVITATNVAGIADFLDQLFEEPEREDVIETYVISKQPNSRRMDPAFAEDAESSS